MAAEKSKIIAARIILRTYEEAWALYSTVVPDIGSCHRPIELPCWMASRNTDHRRMDGQILYNVMCSAGLSERGPRSHTQQKGSVAK